MIFTIIYNSICIFMRLNMIFVKKQNNCASEVKVFVTGEYNIFDKPKLSVSEYYAIYLSHKIKPQTPLWTSSCFIITEKSNIFSPYARHNFNQKLVDCQLEYYKLQHRHNTLMGITHFTEYLPTKKYLLPIHWFSNDVIWTSQQQCLSKHNVHNTQ